MNRLAGRLRATRGSIAGLNATPKAHIIMNGTGYDNPAAHHLRSMPPITRSADLSCLMGVRKGTGAIDDYRKYGKLGPADSRFQGF